MLRRRPGYKGSLHQEQEEQEAPEETSEIKRLSSKESPFLIVDVHNLCWIAYHGMGELDYHGLRTGVAFGFMNGIFKLCLQFNTNKLLFCCDSKKSYRKMKYTPYKENRSDELDDPQEARQKEAARSQIKMVRKEILPELGFKNIYQRPGYEADDLMAVLTQNKKEHFIIISSDQDMLQCLDYNVDIWSPKKKVKITRKDFELAYDDLHPCWWIKIKAYAGCSTDNVKGIEGVGEKKAFQYCKGNLPDGKIKSRIESAEGKKIFKRNIKLVGLPFKGPREFDLPILPEKFRLSDFVDTFDRLGFFSFLKKEELDKWKITFNLKTKTKSRLKIRRKK